MSTALICANIFGWPAIQLCLSGVANRLPRQWFASSDLTTSRATLMKREMLLYRRWFAVRSWKGHLPDGGRWLSGGFPKGRIESRNPAYLAIYAMEARRGEIAHWAMLACTPVFFLWNPPWACAVMTIYGLLANMPCIVAQRYNRAIIITRLLAPSTATL